jgi:signal transduction histidine kinase
MKKFSISEKPLKRNLYLILFLALIALAGSLISISFLYLQRSARGEIQGLTDRIASKYYSELNSEDYFPVVQAIENEMSQMNWTSVSLRSKKSELYKKNQKPTFFGFFSFSLSSTVQAHHEVTLDISTSPRNESLFWILFVILATLVIVIFCSFLIVRSFIEENNVEIERTKKAQNLVHDLRGMTAAIKTIAIDDSAESRLETIILVAQKIEHIILSAQTIGDNEAHDLPVTFADLIEEVLQYIPEARNVLRVEVSGIAASIDLRTLAVEATDLWRIFYNFIRNSAHSSVCADHLKIDFFFEYTNKWRIEITDNGKGIPSELSGQIFVRGATYGKEGGLGIGLASIKETMEKAGGSVRVYQSAQGAKFGLIIPMK